MNLEKVSKLTADIAALSAAESEQLAIGLAKKLGVEILVGIQKKTQERPLKASEDKEYEDKEYEYRKWLSLLPIYRL